MKMVQVFTALVILLCSAIVLANTSLDILPVDKELKEKVITKLSGYQKLSVASEWQSMPKDTKRVLKTIVFDEKQMPVHRTRAVKVLAYFKSDSTRRFLVSVLGISGEAADILKRKAVEVLAAVYGDESVADISKLLKEEDYFIRETVLKSLININSDKSLEVLRRHYKVELVEKLKHLIKNAFVKLGKGL